MVEIVFLDRDTLGPSVSISRPSFEHGWTEYQRTSQDQVVERAKNAEIIITNKVPIRESSIAQLPNLKLIIVAATGYDVIDMESCRKRNILVSNVRNYATTTVPEHVFALIFALRRSIVGYRQDVIDGEWQRAQQFCFFTHPIKDIAGSTLGVVGRGSLGNSVGQMGEALGMRVIYAARKGATEIPEGYTSFEQVITESDILTFHCPLTEQTQDLIAYPELKRMTQRPILINAGRGGLINEVDLVRAVEEDLVAGVGFDCVTTEPIPDDHPFQKIIQRPNVILTPHVAWASESAIQTLWDQVISHIDNFQRGEPTNLLN